MTTMETTLPLNKILRGDALAVLRTLPSDSVDCCVTSPPYWGLRSYKCQQIVFGGDAACEHEWGEFETGRVTGGGNRGPQGKWIEGPSCDDKSVRAWCQKCGAWQGALGLEPSPDLYVAHLVEIMREVRRVLKPWGTLWLNLGDSYYTGKGACHNPGGGDDSIAMDRVSSGAVPTGRAAPNRMLRRSDAQRLGLKPKDIVGVPWMCAFALRSDGWWLRSPVVWAKRNCMPESTEDRPTRSYEMVFQLTKSADYYYDGDAIKEPLAEASVKRISEATFDQQTGGPRDYAHGNGRTDRSSRKALQNLRGKVNPNPRNNQSPPPQADDPSAAAWLGGRQKRDVWFIATEANDLDFCLACSRLYTTGDRKLIRVTVGEDGEKVRTCACGRSDQWVAHFAIMPEALVEPCVAASTSERGLCAACGAPWARLLEKKADGRVRARADAGMGAEWRRETHGLEEVGGDFQEEVSYRTVGWAPTCECGKEGKCQLCDGVGDPCGKGGVCVACGGTGWAVPLPPRRPVVLDPFMGAGTVALVAHKAGRDFLGVELSEDYARLAEARLAPETNQMRLL